MKLSPKASILGAALIFIAALVTISAVKKPERAFGFIRAGHAIEMWNVGGDRWAYFGGNNGSSTAFANVARVELVERGFTEDHKSSPWYRFVKGNQEVVVCDHNEFEVNGRTAPQLSRMIGNSPPQYYPCVLVKNGPGTRESLVAFQIKKLIFRW